MEVKRKWSSLQMIEKEIAYICNYCRKIVCEESNGVDFYSVDDLSGVFKTTCSKACAENLKVNNPS